MMWDGRVHGGSLHGRIVGAGKTQATDGASRRLTWVPWIVGSWLAVFRTFSGGSDLASPGGYAWLTDPGAWEGPETETTSTSANGHFFVGLNKPSDEAATVSFTKAGFVSFSRDFPNGVPSWPYHIDACLDPVAVGAP